LFLDHFHRTSLVAETPDGLSGFLVGIVSPSEPDEAYIHFVGVCPQARGNGLARTLYERFFQIARGHNRHVVRAVTSPVNEGSIAFHQRLGFTVNGPVPDYNGPGRDLVTFERVI
jgi:L-amino acid N-acyltransferase YncA